MRGTCRVPGCAARLYDKNLSGVCKKHTHAADWCGCPECAPHTGFRPALAKPKLVTPPAPDRQRIADRPGVKVVEIAAAVSYSSSDDRQARVTMPAAPWELGA